MPGFSVRLTIYIRVFFIVELLKPHPVLLILIVGAVLLACGVLHVVVRSARIQRLLGFAVAVFFVVISRSLNTVWLSAQAAGSPLHDQPRLRGIVRDARESDWR